MPITALNADQPNRLKAANDHQARSLLSLAGSSSVDITKWCVDFFTTANMKSENQDSLLMMTCLPYQSLSTMDAYQKIAPLLVLVADGVSACQFPKQASQMVIDTVAEQVSTSLAKMAQSQFDALNESHNHPANPSALMSFDDDQIANMIKIAVNRANDLLYFPQVYERVAPFLSTLSGLLCIGDRIHLFHTGDSRIYRVGIDSLGLLSQDHRIHRGHNKGALSAAIGADTRVDMQQSVFTLHQDECLAVMTDGVYEHIEATELQHELCRSAFYASESIAATQRLPADFAISQTLCEQASTEGSHDNLTMLFLRMNTAVNSPAKLADSQSDITRYKLPPKLEVGDSIDGFRVIDVIARTARSEVYLVQDEGGHDYVLKSPSLDTTKFGHYLRDFLKERKIGLSLSKHRRVGESSYNQIDPNHLPANELTTQYIGSGLSASGLLRYYPVPASSPFLYHLTEYIEGESLRDFIGRNAPFDVWQTYDLLAKIGMAVRVMHRNYLLHQDIKPENILLTKSGAIKLIDFGSASSMILQEGTRPPKGDLHYAAPEYYTDAPKGVYSDLFSIAVVGFELLTGQLPFSSQELMNPKHSLIMPTQPLRQHKVPQASEQALMRALHSNTNARHQAIGEFLQDFNPDNTGHQREPEPLIQRNPILFWQCIGALQLMIIAYLLWAYVA